MDPPHAPQAPTSTSSPFTTSDSAWHTRLSFHHSLLSTHVVFTRLYSTCITRCDCSGCSPTGLRLTGGNGSSKERAIRCQGALGRRREERYKGRWGWLEEWGVDRGMRVGGKEEVVEEGGDVLGKEEGVVEHVDVVEGRVEKEIVLQEDMEVDGVEAGVGVGVEIGVGEGRGTKRRREADDEVRDGEVRDDEVRDGEVRDGDDGVTGGGRGAMWEGGAKESIPVQAEEQAPKENQGQPSEEAENHKEGDDDENAPVDPPPRPPSPKRARGRPIRTSLELEKAHTKIHPPPPPPPLPPPPSPTSPRASTPQPPPRPQRSLRMRTRPTAGAITTATPTTSKPVTRPQPPTHTKQRTPPPPTVASQTQLTPNKRKQPHPHPSPTSATSILTGKTYKTTSPPSTFLFYRPHPHEPSRRQTTKPSSKTKTFSKKFTPPKPVPRRKSLILADGELDLDGLIRLCNRAAARSSGTGNREALVLPEGRRWLQRNLRGSV